VFVLFALASACLNKTQVINKKTAFNRNELFLSIQSPPLDMNPKGRLLEQIMEDSFSILTVQHSTKTDTQSLPKAAACPLFHLLLLFNKLFFTKYELYIMY
jgi:hypothetical protein